MPGYRVFSIVIVALADLVVNQFDFFPLDVVCWQQLIQQVLQLLAYVAFALFFLLVFEFDVGATAEELKEFNVLHLVVFG